jgi:uncharacterized membrane protein YkoI
MDRYIRSLLLAAAVATGGALPPAARAAPSDEPQTAPTARISLVEAVTTAEHHVQGRATKAEYENSKIGWVYDVEVVTGTKVFDVRVDANKGTILSSAEDQADTADEGDESD